MRLNQKLYTFMFTLMAMIFMVIPSKAYAGRHMQICTILSGGVGQSANVVCKDTSTGALTQSVSVGTASEGPGGVGGAVTQYGSKLLVTGLAGNAMLLTNSEGNLLHPVRLSTDGSDSVSGALSENGVYVLTGTQILFFRYGHYSAPSSQKNLLQADGSAAQVVVSGGFAYVSEKSGSLESFRLGASGDLTGSAVAVTGIPAGAIVGTVAIRGQVVAPVAHLAITDGSVIPVIGGTTAEAVLPTRELAACWAGADDGEVCITNPGSMTISCGQFDWRGFVSFTSIANKTPLNGDTLFDIDMKNETVGVIGKAGGLPTAFIFEREGDFLTLTKQLLLGTGGFANGAVLLP